MSNPEDLLKKLKRIDNKFLPIVNLPRFKKFDSEMIDPFVNEVGWQSP